MISNGLLVKIKEFLGVSLDVDTLTNIGLKSIKNKKFDKFTLGLFYFRQEGKLSHDNLSLILKRVEEQYRSKQLPLEM